MDRLTLDVANAVSFLPQNSLAGIEPEVLAARDVLENGSGAGNDFLGWVSLPESIAEGDLKRIEDEVARLKALARKLVVVGIGGSYLGARAVIEALGGRGSDGMEVIYAGHTLDEAYYRRLLRSLEDEDFCVVVISKSGTTTEPAIAFRMLRSELERRYGRERARQHIVAVTDGAKGALHGMAAGEGYPAYVIPDNVGGRFSVLTPVGLLPIAAAGFDIRALVAGALAMRTQVKSDPMSAPLEYAAVRNLLYRSGKKVEVMSSFLYDMHYFAEWWKQLYGESEGKDGKGLLPYNLSFTTDLHSLGQYVQEGERLMFETLVKSTGKGGSLTVEQASDNSDGLDYLCGKSLTEINRCAERGTMMAHHDGGVPVIEVGVDKIDESSLGELIYFFEYACGISGYMLGVNPFNQPGVEAYKRNMFKLLGKPGV